MGEKSLIIVQHDVKELGTYRVVQLVSHGILDTIFGTMRPFSISENQIS
jgi:hypothetical protein